MSGFPTFLGQTDDFHAFLLGDARRHVILAVYRVNDLYRVSKAPERLRVLREGYDVLEVRLRQIAQELRKTFLE